MTPPVVSVGVPVYNGARFLLSTLDRLRNQDLADVEIIVSDNGSTDGTQDIARRAAAQDPRIVYVREPRNRGMGWNYNRVLALATAPLFMWNPADDLVHPAYLARCVDALRAHPDALVACSGVTAVDESGATTHLLPDVGAGGGSPDPAVRVRAFLDAHAWDLVYGVLRTDAVRALGGMPHLVGDDVALGVDLLLRGPAAVVPEPLFERRFHAGQSSQESGLAAGAVQQAPGRLPWVSFPYWRLNAELYGRVTRAPLPAATRAAAARAVLLGWTAPTARWLLGDVRRSARLVTDRLRSRVP